MKYLLVAILLIPSIASARSTQCISNGGIMNCYSNDSSCTLKTCYVDTSLEMAELKKKFCSARVYQQRLEDTDSGKVELSQCDSTYNAAMKKLDQYNQCLSDAPKEFDDCLTKENQAASQKELLSRLKEIQLNQPKVLAPVIEVKPPEVIETASQVSEIVEPQFIHTRLRIRIRAIPSSKSKTLSITVPNKQYEVLDEQKNWVQIQFGDREGWVSRAYIIK